MSKSPHGDVANSSGISVKNGLCCWGDVGIAPYEYYGSSPKVARPYELLRCGSLCRTNRDADFGDKFAGGVRQAVVDEGDLA